MRGKIRRASEKVPRLHHHLCMPQSSKRVPGARNAIVHAMPRGRRNAGSEECGRRCWYWTLSLPLFDGAGIGRRDLVSR